MHLITWNINFVTTRPSGINIWARSWWTLSNLHRLVTAKCLTRLFSDFFFAYRRSQATFIFLWVWGDVTPLASQGDCIFSCSSQDLTSSSWSSRDKQTLLTSSLCRGGRRGLQSVKDLLKVTQLVIGRADPQRVPVLLPPPVWIRGNSQMLCYLTIR